MSNPNDPRYPSTGPGPHPQQPEPWPQQPTAQQQYAPAGHYPAQQQPYPQHAQPYPGQPQAYPGQQPYPGYQPYPQFGPTRTFSTSAGAVIALGALGGALAYLFVALPVNLAVDAATLGVGFDFFLRSLTGKIFGIPSVLFFLVYSTLLGALVGAMRLGIRNAAAMIGAGIAFGLLVRTGLGLLVIGPLLTGQVRFGFPVIAWVKLLLSNGLWGLAVAAFLVMTTRR